MGLRYTMNRPLSHFRRIVYSCFFLFDPTDVFCRFLFRGPYHPRHHPGSRSARNRPAVNKMAGVHAFLRYRSIVAGLTSGLTLSSS